MDDPTIIHEEKPESQTKEPPSPFRRRGSLISNVHLLSQTSEPHPNTQFTIMFPKYFPNIAEDTMKQGDNERVLVGFQNFGETVLYIKNITGAFIDDMDPKGDNYMQNLTIDSFNGYPLMPTETFSLAYEFFPFTSLPAPRTYRLKLVLFYADDQYEYSTTVFNQHIHVQESDQQVGITGLFSIILSAAVLFLFFFIIYVKVTDRYFTKEEDLGKRKKSSQKDQGMLAKLRDLISSA